MSDFEMLSIVLMILGIVVTIFDDTWYCRYDLNSIHRSHKKVTAPQPKCAVTFL